MATKVIKDDIIRVRVTKKDKDKLKNIAKDKCTTISEIINIAIRKEIVVYDEKQVSDEKICERAVATESKIQEIKSVLEKRQLENKKGFFKKIFGK